MSEDPSVVAHLPIAIENIEDSDITAKRSQNFSQKREWCVLQGTGERRNLGLGVTFRGKHLRLSLVTYPSEGPALERHKS